jgi:hypothetical protein
MTALKPSGTTSLALCSAAVILFGAFMVLAPRPAMQMFGWMFYGHINGLLEMGELAVRYIMLAHAVLGSVMIGWGVALLQLARSMSGATRLTALKIVGISIGAWFVPDTAYSLLSGFWQNAVLNLGFAVAFGIAIAVARGAQKSLVSACG